MMFRMRVTHYFILQEEMESNMITALYLIMIAVCVAKGRSSSTSQPNGIGNDGVMGNNNGVGALNGGIGIVGFGMRGVEGGDSVKQSLQQLHQVVEKESQVHHTVYG